MKWIEVGNWQSTIQARDAMTVDWDGGGEHWGKIGEGLVGQW